MIFVVCDHFFTQSLSPPLRMDWFRNLVLKFLSSKAPHNEMPPCHILLSQILLDSIVEYMSTSSCFPYSRRFFEGTCLSLPC